MRGGVEGGSEKMEGWWNVSSVRDWREKWRGRWSGMQGKKWRRRRRSR